MTREPSYIVEPDADEWALHSLVQTNFGSKPSRNFIARGCFDHVVTTMQLAEKWRQERAKA